MPKSARRKKRIQKKYIWISYLKIFLSLVVIVSLVVFLFSGRINKDTQKIAVAYPNEDGSASVLVIDYQGEDAAKITLPSDLSVDLSHNLGTFRLKSLWEMGVNEKDPGDIFVKTISKNLAVPVYLYSEKSPFEFRDFVFKNRITNIKLIDRLKIYFKNKSTKNIGFEDIDLAKKLFVKKETLSDGEVGYKIYLNLLSRLGVYFIDEKIVKTQLPLYIVEDIRGAKRSEVVSKIYDTLGGKTVSIDKDDNGDLNCKVEGPDSYTLKLFKEIFGCETVLNKSDKLIFRYGSKFLESY